MAMITLVADGASDYALHVAERDEVATFAAQEIRRYLARISGASLPIVQSQSPRRAIVLSVERDAEEGGQGRYAIEVAEGRVTISGATPFLLLHAAYVFLERIGCRWFAPDYAFYGAPGGSHVPEQATIRLETGRTVATESFRFRKKYVEEGRSHTVETLRALIDWMPKVGDNTFNCPTNSFNEGLAVWDRYREALIPELRRRSIRLEVGGHGFENFIDRETLAAHPDWGGMRPDGTREPDPVKRTFCTGNRAAMDLFRERVLRYVAERPEIDTFALWPPDTPDWCACARCRELGPIETRNALVVNEIARAVQAVRPGLAISFAAYFEPTKPPEGLVFEKNVQVDFCPITRSYEARLHDPGNAVNRAYYDLLNAWFETPALRGPLSLYTYYRKYAWRSLPILLPALIADELRHFHGLGVAGVSSYSEPADWWTYELQHYLLAKMSFDVATSLDGLLRDYFEHRYGPAAGEIAEIVRLLEAFLPQAARIPGSSLSRSVPPSTLYAFMRPSENLLRGYERLVARCRSLLERASARAGLSEQVRERLARWAVLVDYVELEVQARGFALAMSDMPSGGFLEGYVEATRKMASLARANSANGLVLHPRWAEYDRDIAAAFSCVREETP